jgi:transcriptional regulator with XRE-family HTH domain
MATRAGIPINGAKLRRARVQQRMGTARLARLVGCSPGHVRLMERGLRRPSLDLLGRLEAALGVTAEELDAELPGAPLRQPC